MNIKKILEELHKIREINKKKWIENGCSIEELENSRKRDFTNQKY